MNEIKKIEVEVSKEAYELGEGLKNFAVAIKEAMADGWQMGDDLPKIVTAAVASLLPALQGVEKMKAEAKDLEPFTTALMIPLKEIAFLMIKKDTK